MHWGSLRRKKGIPVGAPGTVGGFSEGQKRYLDYYRESVFLAANLKLRTQAPPDLVTLFLDVDRRRVLALPLPHPDESLHLRESRARPTPAGNLAARADGAAGRLAEKTDIVALSRMGLGGTGNTRFAYPCYAMP